MWYFRVVLHRCESGTSCEFDRHFIALAFLREQRVQLLLGLQTQRQVLERLFYEGLEQWPAVRGHPVIGIQEVCAAAHVRASDAPARQGRAAHLTARTVETDHTSRPCQVVPRTLPAPDSVNGSDNEEETKHAMSDRHDSRSARLSR